MAGIEPIPTGPANPQVLTEPVRGPQVSDEFGGVGRAYAGLAELGDQINQIAEPIEKQKAAEAGAASVMADPDTGQLKITPRIEFTGADAAYNHAAVAAYTAQKDGDQDAYLQTLAQKFKGDAVGFKSAAAAWLKESVKGAPPIVRGDIQNAGFRKISQFTLGISKEANDQAARTQLLDIGSAADRAANRVNDLAYSAGTDTEDFKHAASELNTWLDQAKNPIFGEAGQKLAESKGDKLNEAQLYAVQGHFERDPRVATDPEAVIADAKGQIYDAKIDATIEQKNARYAALTEHVRSTAVKANAAAKDYLNSLDPHEQLPQLTKAIKGPTGTPLDILSPGEKELALRSAQNDLRIEADRARFEQERQAVHLRVGLENDYTNAAAMVERGFPAARLPSDHQIEAAYPLDPEKAALVKEQVTDLQTISGFLKGLPTATPEQVAKLRAEVAPDPGNPDTFARRARISTALDSALTARAKAVSTDPAGYLLAPTPNSPHGDLQALYTAAVQNPTAPASRIPMTAAGQTVFGAYADHMQSVQATMGVPEAAQHILPVMVAQSMATSISTDPAQAAQKIQQLQGQFGDTWPKVWHDLTTLGKLPSEYQLIGAMDNRQDAELLARAMTEGKGGKNVDDLLPPQTSAAIKRDVLANPQLQQYLFSLDASGASDAQKIGIRDAVVKLAYAKAFYGQDTAAAPNAIKSVIGNYEFLGGARIPTASSGAIKTNAAATVRGLDADKIAVPDTYGKPGMPAVRDYLDALKATPNWITSPKGDALWLKDSGNRIVIDKKGKPIAVPFNAGTMAPAPVDTPQMTPGL